jgi:hypothetical protein
VPAERAAALRVAVAGVWLVELLDLRSWQADFYDIGVPGQAVIFDLWILATVALMIGLQPRIAAAFSFVCFLMFMTFGGVIYHIDLVAHIATFYLIFIDSGRVWSVGSWWRRRNGAAVDRQVWGFPISMLLLHFSAIYLDAGLSHLILNPTWRSGEAVWQAWGHPQWATSIAPVFLGFPILGLLATFATMVFELSFWLVAVVVVADLVRYRVAAFACFVAIFAFQVGIIVSFDIGLFSHFMLAAAVPYLPWERFGQSTSTSASRTPLSRGERFVVAGLSSVVAISFVLLPPVTSWSNSPGGEGSPVLGARILMAMVGDQRPHNVFSDPVVATVFLPRVIDAAGRERLVLFGTHAERIGDMKYVRAFMTVERMLRSSPTDRPFAYAILKPVLNRAAARGDLDPGAYRLILSAIPRGADNPSSELELFAFSVTPSGAVLPGSEAAGE